MSLDQNWSGGIVSNFIRPSPASYKNTVGVLGNFDGNPYNDRFILQKIKRNGSLIDEILLADEDTVAAFWRYIKI